MVLERKDRVRETTTTTGTGTINLAGAVTGYQAFVDAVTSGATVRYYIELEDLSEWEVGEGVFTDATPDTLSRVTVYASSNSGSLVNFSAGTKTVELSLVAEDIKDPAINNLIKNGNFINNSTNGYGGTPDDWTDDGNANPVQGGFPSFTKQDLIDIGFTDGQIEALWNLNEASGNMTDLSSNSNDLTDTNTVGSSDDGLMAKARDFVAASTEYGTVNAANLRITGTQTFFCFFKPDSVSGPIRIMGRGNSGAAFNFVNLVIDSDGTLQFQCQNLTTNTTINTDVVLETGKWYIAMAGYDSSNSKLWIWLNGIYKEITASGSATAAGTETFSVGRCGAYAADYYDGLVQNAGVLSATPTENQRNLYWANTLYKGLKIRRATTNGYMYQNLPQDLVERLRGKDISIVSRMYQDTASIGTVEIDDGGASSPTAESATQATTGSWLDTGISKTINTDASKIELKLKASTSNGNVWWKEVAVYEGNTLVYVWYPSHDDICRLCRLMAMDIPQMYESKPYQYEEKRWYDWVPDLTTGSVDISAYDTARFMFDGNSLFYKFQSNGGNLSGSAGTIRVTLPIKGNGGSSFEPYTAYDGSSFVTALAGDNPENGYVEFYKTSAAGNWAATETSVQLFRKKFYEID